MSWQQAGRLFCPPQEFCRGRVRKERERKRTRGALWRESQNPAAPLHPLQNRFGLKNIPKNRDEMAQDLRARWEQKWGQGRAGKRLMGTYLVSRREMTWAPQLPRAWIPLTCPPRLCDPHTSKEPGIKAWFEHSGDNDMHLRKTTVRKEPKANWNHLS